MVEVQGFGGGVELIRSIRARGGLVKVIFDAEEEFTIVKRFGNIIFGAELEATNNVLGVVVGSEKNERQGGSGAM